MRYVFKGTGEEDTVLFSYFWSAALLVGVAASGRQKTCQETAVDRLSRVSQP